MYKYFKIELKLFFLASTRYITHFQTPVPAASNAVTFPHTIFTCYPIETTRFKFRMVYLEELSKKNTIRIETLIEMEMFVNVKDVISNLDVPLLSKLDYAGKIEMQIVMRAQEILRQKINSQEAISRNDGLRRQNLEELFLFVKRCLCLNLPKNNYHEKINHKNIFDINCTHCSVRK